MKRSVIEQKLNEALQRLAAALGEERYFTSEIMYHDRCASETRKERQKARDKKARAEAAIAKLSSMLAEHLEEK